MLRWAHRGTESVARPKPFGALIFDNRWNDEGAPERYRARKWWALTRRFLALTRDHENWVASQSLSRFEAACLSVGVKTSFGQRQTAAFSLTA